MPSRRKRRRSLAAARRRAKTWARYTTEGVMWCEHHKDWVPARQYEQHLGSLTPTGQTVIEVLESWGVTEPQVPLHQ